MIDVQGKRDTYLKRAHSLGNTDTSNKTEWVEVLRLHLAITNKCSFIVVLIDGIKSASLVSRGRAPAARLRHHLPLGGGYLLPVTATLVTSSEDARMSHPVVGQTTLTQEGTVTWLVHSSWLPQVPPRDTPDKRNQRGRNAAGSWSHLPPALSAGMLWGF